MRGILLAFAIALPGFAAADAVGDTCLACHKDALSLKGREAAAIAVRLKDMRDGRARHPTALPRLTDAELEELARAVTAK